MSSPLILPTPLASGAGAWQLSDFTRVALVSRPASGGIATATGPQLEPDEAWLVDRAVCFCTSATATTLRLYESAPGPGFLLSGSGSGNFDEADYPAGLLVQPSRELVAVWSGAADGAVGTLTVQVRIMRPGG